MRIFESARYLAIAIAVVSCMTAAARPDSALRLQPGQRYVIKKYTGVVPCPGNWADYRRLQGLSFTDSIRTVVKDGGTTFITGNSFTVVSLGNTPDAPVHIRSSSDNKLCWLTQGAILDLIR